MKNLNYYLKLSLKLLLLCLYTIIVFDCGKAVILSRMMDTGSVMMKAGNSDCGISYYLKIFDLDNTLGKTQKQRAKEFLKFEYYHLLHNSCISEQNILNSINHLNNEERAELLSRIVKTCDNSSDHCDGSADFWRKASKADTIKDF